VISEDRLGMNQIYLQAKRWQGNVDRPIAQEFVGALTGKKVRKGVIITTSDFRMDAQRLRGQSGAKGSSSSMVANLPS
jgi:restriction system protein